LEAEPSSLSGTFLRILDPEIYQKFLEIFCKDPGVRTSIGTSGVYKQNYACIYTIKNKVCPVSVMIDTNYIMSLLQLIQAVPGLCICTDQHKLHHVFIPTVTRISWRLIHNLTLIITHLLKDKIMKINYLFLFYLSMKGFAIICQPEDQTTIYL
jgi:hypothetical protein